MRGGTGGHVNPARKKTEGGRQHQKSTQKNGKNWARCGGVEGKTWQEKKSRLNEKSENGKK